MPEITSFSAIKVTQPIGEFYIGSMSKHLLCEITYVDVRRIEKERDIETYLGIQRPLNLNRVKEISEYAHTVDACFPSAVILAIDGDLVEYDERTKQMVIKEKDSEGNDINLKRVAKVLDGQHRIEGLRDYDEEFEVNISVFVDIDIAQQAYIFSTVNLAQTKVNKSLVYDLYELAKTRSPEKLCHTVAAVLNQEEGSPFEARIKRLGVATNGVFSETITQATFVTSLLQYMSKNAIQDRDLYKRKGTPQRASQEESQQLIFRNMMIEEKDYELIDILWNYFSAVRDRWPQAWNEGGQGMILNRTNGFRALMRFLRYAYLSIAEPGEIPSEEQFLAIFNTIDFTDNDFNVQNFRPGSSGEADLFNSLLDRSGLRP